MNAILFLAMALVPSAPGDDVRVTYVDAGFQYPATTVISSSEGKQLGTQECLGFKKDAEAPGFTIKPGTLRFLTRHSRFGFPQPVEYALKDDKGVVQWESGVTVDDKQVVLKAGQTLEIRIQRPFVSYNSHKVRLQDIDTPVMIVGARPYWFYFAQKGEFPLDAPEKYPNGIFFLCDAEWGIKGVAKDLAAKVHSSLQQADNQTYDHRGACHWSLLHGVTPEGKVPEALRKVAKEDWQKAIEAAFTSMLERNCYRPFDAQTVRQLKAIDFLPKETPDQALVITLGQGVEYGRLYRQRWLDMREQERKAAEKK